MPKIKTLTVHNFRGIRNSTLDLDGCSVLILGENGTGKSSFVDALEFYFSGTVSHLEGAQGISTSRHAPHIHSDTGQTDVTMTFGNPEISLARTLRSFSEVDEDLREFHAVGEKARFILRRKNLLDFILAQPGPRYEQLAAIIGVSDLDKLERTLKQVRDDLDSNVCMLRNQVQAEEYKLDELIGLTDHSDDGILTALNSKLVELKQPILQTLVDIESRKLTTVSTSRSPEDTQKAVNIQNSLTQAQKISDKIYFLGDHEALWQEIDSLRADAAQVRELLFQEALIASRKILEEYSDLDYCPICMQQIDRQMVLKSLEKRVREAHVIEEKSSLIKDLRNDLTTAIQNRLADIESLSEKLLTLNNSWDALNLESYISLLEDIAKALTADPVEISLPTFLEVIDDPAIANSEKALQELATSLTKEKTRLEPTEQDQLIVDVIDLLTRVMDSRDSLLALRPKLAAKVATHHEMNTIYDCFISTKRIEIKRSMRTWKGISNDTSSVYTKMKVIRKLN